MEIAAKELNLPDISSALAGPTGVISGGSDAAAVAKAVSEFFKTRENSEIKLGIFDEKVISKEEVIHLGSLPSLPEMRAKLLSLINTPASQLVRVVFMRVEKLEGGDAPAAEQA